MIVSSIVNKLNYWYKSRFFYNLEIDTMLPHEPGIFEGDYIIKTNCDVIIRYLTLTFGRKGAERSKGWVVWYSSRNDLFILRDFLVAFGINLDLNKFNWSTKIYVEEN